MDAREIPRCTQRRHAARVRRSVAAKDAMSVMGLIDALEELDDVQQVYSNLEFSEEAVAQYAAQAA